MADFEPTSPDTAQPVALVESTTLRAGSGNAIVIAGTDRTSSIHYESGVTIERTLNERGRATFTCASGYIPSRLDDVKIYREDGVSLLFGGLVMQRSMTGTYEQALASHTTVEAVDYSVYLEWCYLDLSYTQATTLKTVLLDLVAALPDDYGITLDGMEAYGDALTGFAWTNTKAADALRELSTRTGRAWQVNADKVLLMPSLPRGTAPETFTDATPNALALSWDDPTEIPANTVLLACGPTGEALVTKILNTDGVTRSWTWTAPEVAANPFYSWGCWVIRDGYTIDTDANKFYVLVEHDVNQSLPGWHALFDYDTLTFSIDTDWTDPAYHVSSGVFEDGYYILWQYYGRFPFLVEATTAATPRIEIRYTDESVTDYDQGVEVAEGLLDAIEAEPRAVTAVSRTHGWEPGQALTISLTGRSFDTTALVTGVRIGSLGAGAWRYEIDAVENDVYTGSYQDEWRDLVGTGNVSEATAVSTANSGMVGIIAAFAASSPPTGWLACNGQTVSRATYATLFAVIGTTFGAGDGTTFGLPDLRGRFILGQAASGTGSSFAGTGGAIDHTHGVGSLAFTITGTTADESDHTHPVTGTATSDGAHTHTIDTDTQGSHSHTVSGSAGVATGSDYTVVENGATTSSDGSHDHGGDALSAGAHTHTLDGTAGDPDAHSHGAGTLAASGGSGASGTGNPPFMALIWCIRAS